MGKPVSGSNSSFSPSTVLNGGLLRDGCHTKYNNLSSVVGDKKWHHRLLNFGLLLYKWHCITLDNDIKKF